MRQTYIVTFDDTGKMPQIGWEARSIIYNAGTCIIRDKHLPREHPLLKALSIGQKVLELAGDMELGEPKLSRYTIDGTESGMVTMYFNPKKPKPLKGLAWLKSLPVGTRLCNSTESDDGRFIVMPDGLRWVLWPEDVWRWDGGGWGSHSWHDVGWVQEACLETCPEWEPATNK